MERNIDLEIKALQSAIRRSKSQYLKKDLNKKIWRLMKEKRREMAGKRKSD